MNEKTSKLVRLIGGWVFTALTVTVAALLISQLLSILVAGVQSGYTDGKGAFSREIVAEHLSAIAPVLWIWVAAVVVLFVLWEVFPVTEKKKPYSDASYLLARYIKRVPQTVGGELAEELRLLRSRKKIIKIIRICCLAFTAGLIVYGIVYLAIPAHFTQMANANREVVAMAVRFVPCTLAAMAVWIAASVYENITAKRLLPQAKKLAAGNKNVAKAESKLVVRLRAITEHKFFLPAVRGALLAAGIVLLVCGVFNGNMAGIFRKAINICTECIGLG